MRKTARLDQILLTLGYANQDQITRALARQRSHGGRLGMNLVECGFITTDQLLAALSEQYQLPSVVPSESEIPSDLLERIPAKLVTDHLLLPLAWNQEQKVLTLAVANPEEEEAVARVRELFGARAIRFQLAPDRHVREIGSRLVVHREEEVEEPTGVELPELFELEESVGSEPDDVPVSGEHPPRRRVLMVTAGAPQKNFLPPILQREGVDLTVVGRPEEAREAMTETGFDAVLLAQEMVDEYGTWIRSKEVPDPGVEVVIYPSISDALLENPLPYEATLRSLRASLQALADHRCAILGGSPPYGLIGMDLEVLAQKRGMRRVASDGLHLAAHLLLPARGDAAADPLGSPEPFSAFASSLELATRIRFPWRLDAVLDACHALYSGRAAQGHKGRWNKEVRTAAQILALVWYRHNHVPAPAGTAEEAMLALRTSLREVGNKLASFQLVEAYLRLIADRGGALSQGADRQVLLVGGERISRSLAPGLKRVGCQTVVTDELADAQTMAERRPPGAIVMDFQEFPKEVDRFARVAKLDDSVLLFVLTDTTDPALVLNLLDIGVDDVFGPPHDFDIMAARINRAIVSRARQRPAGQNGGGQFSATFEIFSFLDLIQTLAQGFKTVRIDLAGGPGETATIWLKKGRMVHASCGKVAGASAVYRVIAWEDEGEFTVHTETRTPEPNIQESNESILMEGCRLLDESKR